MLKMVCNNDFVYVLYNDKNIDMFEAGNLKGDAVASYKGDGKASDIVLVGEELWLGDTDGFVHALDKKL